MEAGEVARVVERKRARETEHEPEPRRRGVVYCKFHQTSNNNAKLRDTPATYNHKLQTGCRNKRNNVTAQASQTTYCIAHNTMSVACFPPKNHLRWHFGRSLPAETHASQEIACRGAPGLREQGGICLCRASSPDALSRD